MRVKTIETSSDNESSSLDNESSSLDNESSSSDSEYTSSSSNESQDKIADEGRMKTRSKTRRAETKSTPIVMIATCDVTKKKKKRMHDEEDSSEDNRKNVKKLLRLITGEGKKRGREKKSTAFVNVAYDAYTAEESEYYMDSRRHIRRKIAELEQRMRDLNESKIPLRFKVLLSEVDDKIKAVAIKKVDALYNLDGSSSEYYKILAWIEALCSLPISKYCSLPVDANSSKEHVRTFLWNVREQLNSTVYGHNQAKEQIIRLIAQWVINPNAKGMVIGIHGSCGVGKTTLVKDGICKVLNMPFAFLPLGGASDASFLEGHSYTYEGSTWGKIVDVLMKCKVSNPVLYFDELDKVSTSHKGDEIINKLIHLTDSSQNERFTDKYFYDVDIDLSRCLVIFSYNHEDQVNPILRDRMVRIRTEGYSLKDKKAIAKDFLIPKMLAEFSMKLGDISFSEDIIAYIVEYVEQEEGVRNLKRALHEIISSLNLLRLVSPEENVVAFPLEVTKQHVSDYVKSGTKAHAQTSCHMMYT